MKKLYELFYKAINNPKAIEIKKMYRKALTFLGNHSFVVYGLLLVICIFIYKILGPTVAVTSVAGLLAIYFAEKRLFHKVGIKYTWGSQRIHAPGIRSVTLINYKDRTIPIFEIYCIIEEGAIKLKMFEPPLILKPYEAVSLEIEPVSSYSVPGGSIEDPFLNVQFYITTADSHIKCIFKGPPNMHNDILKPLNKHQISQTTIKYHGYVISDFVKYAVHYTYKNEECVSFIDISGYINWRFAPNKLEQSFMDSPDDIEEALQKSKAGQFLSNIRIEDPHKNNFLRKPS